MKTLYITLSTINKSDEELLKVRDDAIRQTKSVVGDSVEVLEILKDISNDALLPPNIEKAIKLIDKANVVYFGTGWRESLRCRFENMYANAHNLVMIEN